MRRKSTTGASASVALVWPFLALAERGGRDDASSRVRAYLGLSQAQLADPNTRVPVAQLAELLDAAIRRAGSRDIGLLAAQHVAGVHLGLMEDVTRTVGTVWAAFEEAVRYLPLVSEGVHYDFAIDDELAISTLWFDPTIRFHEAAVEFVLAVGLLWARRVTGVADLAPREVHFTHAQPDDISLHRKLFRCTLRFDAPVTQVVMSARSLDRPLRGGEPVLADLLRKRAQGMLEQLPRASDTAGEVRRILASQRDLQHVTADQVARRLGLGTRTLARRLRDEQTSFRELLDEVRGALARRLLAETELPITEIAQSLGFASPQAFNRAFRRWTGSSAGAYRRSRR